MHALTPHQPRLVAPSARVLQYRSRARKKHGEVQRVPATAALMELVQLHRDVRTLLRYELGGLDSARSTRSPAFFDEVMQQWLDGHLCETRDLLDSVVLVAGFEEIALFAGRCGVLVHMLLNVDAATRHLVHKSGSPPNSAGHIPHRHHFFSTTTCIPSPVRIHLAALNTSNPPTPTRKHEQDRRHGPRRVPSPHRLLRRARRRRSGRHRPGRHARGPRRPLRHVLPLRRLRRQRDAQQGRAGGVPALRGAGAVQGAHEAVSAFPRPARVAAAMDG